MGSISDPPGDLVDFIFADRFKWSPDAIAAMPIRKRLRFQQILSAEADMARMKSSE